MQILQSWKESLSLFNPSNFKLFFLVSVQAFMRAVQTMVIYWGWLILLFWTYDYFLPQNATQHSLFIDVLFRSVLLFLMICSVRASTPLKNGRYFVNVFVKVWPVVPITIALYWLNVHMPSVNSFFDTSFYLFFSVVLTLYLLFVTDTEGGVYALCISAYRACKLLLFNIPWFIIIAFAFTVIELVLLALAGYVAQFSSGVAMVLHELIQAALYGFQVTMVTNFYIKRLYDQLEVYFVLPS